MDERRSHVDALVTRARSEPKSVLAEAPGVLAELPADAHTGRSVVLRAAGLAARWAGTTDESIELLEQSIVEAQAGNDATLVVEATLSLSGTLAIAGEMTIALETLEAMGAVDDASLRARVDFQLGSIYARMAQPARATEAWARALPQFRAEGDRLREAMTRRNRGFLNVFAGDLDVAEEDLRAAAELFEELGIAAELAGVELNLGLVALYRGDIPEALQRFDASESRVAELTGAVFEVQVSHCEALLSAGLYSEAAHLAASARSQMEAAGMGADAAEATLVLAAAELRAGHRRAAEEAAQSAEALFEDQGRTGWSAHARFLALLAAYGEAPPTQRDRRGARRLAADLAAAGQYIPAVGARLIAGRIGLDLDDVAGARSDLEAVAAHRNAGPVEVTIQSWLALALLRRAAGNARGADAAARAGMRSLAEHQAALGATDVRTGIADHALELGRLGLELALDSRDNRRLWRWMERTRAGALRLRPVTPPRDPELAAATAELRRLTRALRSAAHSEIAGVRRRQTQLQRRIAAHVRRVEGRHDGDEGGIVGLGALHDALGPRIMVELARAGDQLVALVIYEGTVRRTVLRDAGSVQAEVDSLRLLMRRAIRSDARQQTQPLIADVARRLDATLLAPLGLPAGPLVIVPPADVYSVPWPLLPTCRDRTVAVAPSATTWVRARRTHPSTAPPLLAAGPRLDHASEEVRRLHELYPAGVRFSSRNSTVEHVMDAMDGAPLAHFACHGSYNAENPMFSALHLADGDLTVYDLERLGRAPQLVVLSACEAGLSAARSGDELLGLATAFHALGTQALVASVGLVPDSAATRRLMLRFHRHVVAGVEPAEALARATAAAVSPEEKLAAASFVCFGGG